MKRHLLSRYERGVDGSILIDVTATRTEDLYSDFDRSAPYVRRDLDQDLVDYLVYCAILCQKRWHNMAQYGTITICCHINSPILP